MKKISILVFSSLLLLVSIQGCKQSPEFSQKKDEAGTPPIPAPIPPPRDADQAGGPISPPPPN